MPGREPSGVDRATKWSSKVVHNDDLCHHEASHLPGFNRGAAPRSSKRAREANLPDTSLRKTIEGYQSIVEVSRLVCLDRCSAESLRNRRAAALEVL